MSANHRVLTRCDDLRSILRTRLIDSSMLPSACRLILSAQVVTLILPSVLMSQSSGVSQRDSAAIQIVENRGNLWSAVAGWALSAQPVLRIGAQSGQAQYLFDRISGIAVLNNGSIVVGNAGGSTIRWFDPEGTFLFERGRRGEGPGEFQGMGPIRRGPGNTIVATDRINRRAIQLSAGGDLIQTIGVDFAPASPGFFRLASDEWIVAHQGISAVVSDMNRPAGNFFQSYEALVRISPNGTRHDTLRAFAGQQIGMRSVDGGDVAFQTAPLTKNFHYFVRDNLPIFSLCIADFS